MLCAWSHLNVSKWLYEQALEGDRTQLGPVTGLSAGLPASRKCTHLTEMSEGGRSSLGEDELGQEQGKPPPGERNGGAHVGVGVYMGGKSVS